MVSCEQAHLGGDLAPVIGDHLVLVAMGLENWSLHRRTQPKLGARCQMGQMGQALGGPPGCQVGQVGQVLGGPSVRWARCQVGQVSQVSQLSCGLGGPGVPVCHLV